MKSTQYDAIDALIIAAVRKRYVTPLYDNDVRAEANWLQRATGRDAFRIIDGRLQELRRRGVIAFHTQSTAPKGLAGWSVVE